MTNTPNFDMKICGLSTQADIAAAISAGASMIGLVFFEKSPRNVSLSEAKTLVEFARKSATAFPKIVALTVDATDEVLNNIHHHVEPDIFQCHGSESPERIRSIKRMLDGDVMKAMGVSEAADFQKIAAYTQSADSLLIDAKPPKDSPLPGGNGLTFDWRILDALTNAVSNGLPVMLSGGLNTQNVASAVRLSVAHPVISGIDVSSGVETSPGVKDKDLIETFLRLAKAAQTSHKSQKGFAA